MSAARDGRTLLLGSAHFCERPLDRGRRDRLARELRARPAPPLPPAFAKARVLRALFVPAAAPRTAPPGDVLVVTAARLLAAGRPSG